MGTRLALEFEYDEDKNDRYIDRILKRKNTKSIYIGSMHIDGLSKEEIDKIKLYFNDVNRVIKDIYDSDAEIPGLCDIDTDKIRPIIKVVTDYDGKLKSGYVNNQRSNIQLAITQEKLRLFDFFDNLEAKFEVVYFAKEEIPKDKCLNDVIMLDDENDIDKEKQYKYRLKTISFSSKDLSFKLPNIYDHYTVEINSSELIIDLISNGLDLYDSARLFEMYHTIKPKEIITIGSICDFFNNHLADYLTVLDNFQFGKDYYDIDKYADRTHFVRMVDVRSRNRKLSSYSAQNELNDICSSVYRNINSLVKEYNSYLPHGSNYPY